jgi:hypothetical protein
MSRFQEVNQPLGVTLLTRLNVFETPAGRKANPLPDLPGVAADEEPGLLGCIESPEGKAPQACRTNCIEGPAA